MASSTGSWGGDFFFFGFSAGDAKGETSSLGFERTTLRERPSGSSDFVEDEAVSEGTPPPLASTVRTDPGACCRFDDEDEGEPLYKWLLQCYSRVKVAPVRLLNRKRIALADKEEEVARKVQNRYLTRA